MCGIAGVVTRPDSPPSREALAAMISAIRHRGPDGDGVHVDGCVGLAHRRLAIIDLTPDGAQPMHWGGGRYTLTFNGEIYNYIEIRDELKALGVSFHTHSDSEVILAAYAQWGESCVRRFNGMWAFVIHDRVRNVLFGSRDRFGVKPFYYIEQPERFAFASEIRQLLPLLPAVRVNAPRLTEFLLTSFSDHTDETYFRDVRKLPASHNFILDLGTRRLSLSRYYEISLDASLRDASPIESVRAYGDIFRDAVRLRLRSDVKVGTCLSGGLDSSSVAAVAAALHARETRDPFAAITAVSEQASNDESGFARQVVDHCGLNWLPVKPTYEDFVSTLPAVVATQEEPYAGPSINMQYFVMRQARAHGVTVLLDGQGGDETLLGYEKYYAAYYAAIFRRHGLLATLSGLRRAGRNNAKMNLRNSLMYLVGGLSSPARYWFYRWRHHYLRDPGPLPWFLSAFAREALNEHGLQKLEIESTNLPILLRYEDKNSMAHSIETRLPFLDYRALETALSIPTEHKIRDGWTKWILREAMRDELPESIVWRRNKFGFEAPEQIWLRQHLPEMQRVVAASPLLAVLTDRDKLLASYPRLDLRSRWRLYSVALWEHSFGVLP